MAHRDDDSRPRVRLHLPAHRLTRLLGAAALGLSCVAAPPQQAAPPPTSAPPATAEAAASPAAPPPASPSTPPPPTCADPCRGAPRTVGSFAVTEAPEASGLVSSRRHDDVLYVVDDGPGTTGVLAISARNARIIGRVEVEGLSGTDTEALAAGPCGPGGGRCVYIGDIGDNLRQRGSVAVHRFREPRRLRGGATVAAEVATLRYPDEPHDAEALLVDARGRMGIVTKAADESGTGSARLFVAAEFGDTTLADRGAVDIPAPILPLAAAVVGNVVTGGEWAPGRVVLRTYDGAVEFRAPGGHGGLLHFAEWPVTDVATASEQQGEAIAYGPDRCSVYTVSEGSGALSVSPCR